MQHLLRAEIMFEHVIGCSKRLVHIATTQMEIQRNVGAAFVFEMFEIGKGARGLKHFVHYSCGRHRFNFVEHRRQFVVFSAD